MDRDEDTLSFASLVQPNVPIKPRAGRPKQLSAGPSFEFRQVSTPPSSSPADLLFTNGTVSPCSPFPVDYKGSSSMRRCLRQGNGRRSADSAPKRVSFQEPVPAPRRSTSSPLPERGSNFGAVGARPELKYKRDVEKGKGLLGSIILACRDCRAVEPSKRVGNLAS